MKFNYKTIDTQGKEYVGSLIANDKDKAANQLLSKGFSVLSLEEEKKKAVTIEFLRRVNKKDMVIFSKSTSILFSSEIPALRVLKVIASQTHNKYLQETLFEVVASVQKGSSLSGAFAAHPKIFDNFFVNIVEVGEESGTLPRSFEYLADYYKRSHDLQSRVKRALTYPIFIIVIFAVVIALMMVIVIPQISTILINSNAELPFVTKIVIGASDFLVQYGYLILVAIIVFAIFMFKYLSTSIGRYWWDDTKLRLPLFGRLFRLTYTTRLADNLSILLQSGVSILRSIQVVQGSVENEVYREMLIDVEKRVRGGSSLSGAFATSKHIDPSFVQIIRVGEEAGELQPILQVLSGFFEQEVRNTVDTLVDLIQPAIVVLLGVGVGGILGAVLLPIYGLASAI